MARHVSAVFDNHDQAASAVHLLRENKFWDREMTIIAEPGEQEDSQRAEYEHKLTDDNARGGAWAGSALGAAVAGATGLLSIALIPATPLLMVGGAALGGAAGNVFGSAGLGEKQLDKVKDTLHRGGVLIVVHQETDDRAKQAAELMKQANGKEIAIAN